MGLRIDADRPAQRLARLFDVARPLLQFGRRDQQLFVVGLLGQQGLVASLGLDRSTLCEIEHRERPQRRHVVGLELDGRFEARTRALAILLRGLRGRGQQVAGGILRLLLDEALRRLEGLGGLAASQVQCHQLQIGLDPVGGQRGGRLQLRGAPIEVTAGHCDLAEPRAGSGLGRPRCFRRLEELGRAAHVAVGQVGLAGQHHQAGILRGGLLQQQRLQRVDRLARPVLSQIGGGQQPQRRRRGLDLCGLAQMLFGEAEIA